MKLSSLNMHICCHLINIRLQLSFILFRRQGSEFFVQVESELNEVGSQIGGNVGKRLSQPHRRATAVNIKAWQRATN